MSRLTQTFIFYQPMDSKSIPLGTEIQQNELRAKDLRARVRIGRSRPSELLSVEFPNPRIRRRRIIEDEGAYRSRP